MVCSGPAGQFAQLDLARRMVGSPRPTEIQVKRLARADLSHFELIARPARADHVGLHAAPPVPAFAQVDILLGHADDFDCRGDAIPGVRAGAHGTEEALEDGALSANADGIAAF